jgi:hypothetical protein
VDRPRLIVTGSQHSATAYTATLLTRLGCPCGHEAVFNPDNLRRRAARLGVGILQYLLAQVRTPRRVDVFMRPLDVRVDETLPWPAGLEADSSWLAAPYLASLPDGTVVLHQVRDPLAVLRSLVRRRFARPSVYRAFAAQHVSGLSGSLVQQSMQYWTAWNQMIEAACRLPHLRPRRLRVEELSVPVLQPLLALAGHDRTPDEIERALDDVPRGVNTWGPKGRDAAVRPETLPRGGLFDEMVRMARAYGYESLG